MQSALQMATEVHQAYTGRVTNLGTITGKGRLPDRHVLQTHAVYLGVVDAIHLQGRTDLSSAKLPGAGKGIKLAYASCSSKSMPWPLVSLLLPLAPRATQPVTDTENCCLPEHAPAETPWLTVGLASARQACINAKPQAGRALLLTPGTGAAACPGPQS